MPERVPLPRRRLLQAKSNISIMNRSITMTHNRAIKTIPLESCRYCLNTEARYKESGSLSSFTPYLVSTYGLQCRGLDVVLHATDAQYARFCRGDMQLVIEALIFGKTTRSNQLDFTIFPFSRAVSLDPVPDNTMKPAEQIRTVFRYPCRGIRPSQARETPACVQGFELCS